MLEHLASTLTKIEGKYLQLDVGNFNRLNIRCLATEFRLKQLVNKPIRGNRISDLVLTNLPLLYDINSETTLPLFHLFDHDVAVLHPKEGVKCEGSSRKVISRRDTHASRKLVLGRFPWTISSL